MPKHRSHSTRYLKYYFYFSLDGLYGRIRIHFFVGIIIGQALDTETFFFSKNQRINIKKIFFLLSCNYCRDILGN
jgi:hypothetical protein